jgi:hypothetical protein
LLLLSLTFLRITARTNSADVTFVGYNVKARTVTMHVIADWQYFIYVKYAGNISDSRELVWPWHCMCFWGFLYLRASLMVKTCKSCHKHKPLPQHLSLCTGRHLLCVQFIRSLKSKLYTDLTKQNTTGSKSIQSHAEETNEIQLSVFWTGILRLLFKQLTVWLFPLSCENQGQSQSCESPTVCLWPIFVPISTGSLLFAIKQATKQHLLWLQCWYFAFYMKTS